MTDKLDLDEIKRACAKHAFLLDTLPLMDTHEYANYDGNQFISKIGRWLPALIAALEAERERVKELERIAEAARTAVATCQSMLPAADSGPMKYAGNAIQSLANALRQNNALEAREVPHD